jgi:hypothetical protein
VIPLRLRAFARNNNLPMENQLLLFVVLVVPSWFNSLSAEAHDEFIRRDQRHADSLAKSARQVDNRNRRQPSRQPLQPTFKRVPIPGANHNAPALTAPGPIINSLRMPHAKAQSSQRITGI